MPICEVGAIQKHPDGNYYRKDLDTGDPCIGCAYRTKGGNDACPSVDGKCYISTTRTAISDGGCDCDGAIWVKVAPPTPPVKWEPRTLSIGPKVPKTTLHALVLEGLDEINQLGRENAKLKNQITKLKESK